ncbi:GL27286 [Drosophila persimilis]|uniref:GL27286 n=1 Tax=Drosophila persimilis TaxID=7234 RepID=B4GZ15_DROPE|nr:tctex1 domain-containing protein 2 [Drosophila persimilis]EDW28033.1 GL27286 [Drosophila persimilis]
MAEEQLKEVNANPASTSPVTNEPEKTPMKPNPPAPLSASAADEGQQTEKAVQAAAYSMRPAFGEMFPLPIVKNIMNSVMTEKLKDKTYDKDVAKIWTLEIADEVNQKIASNPKVRRYKHVVQVMLGQELGAGGFYNSRCCWDCDCDTSVSEVFSNTSIFCVCTVFGTYQY